MKFNAIVEATVWLVAIIVEDGIATVLLDVAVVDIVIGGVLAVDSVVELAIILVVL